jgi:hypothetical protein
MAGVDGSMKYRNLKKLYSFLFMFLIVGSLFYIYNCSATEIENLVEADFDISFISGTHLTVEITIFPQKLTTDRVYYTSDIITASSEEIGALKYAVFLMLKDQLSILFRGVTLNNFTLPMLQSGVFTEYLDLNLDSEFFNMSSTVSTHELINGFLDMGASISYVFPFAPETGWNTTYTIYLPQEIVLDSVNTIDVTSDGGIISWNVANWYGTAPSKEGHLSIKEKNPSTASMQEQIEIIFDIDSRSPSHIILDTNIIAKSLSIESYNVLPEFILNIQYLPSDGIRLLIKNQLLSLEDLFRQTYQPIIQHITSVIENTSFNQSYQKKFSWDQQTIINTTHAYDISMMDTSPPIIGKLIDENIALTFLGLSGRAFFGLLNAGAVATLNSNDINFGSGLHALMYPYAITLTLPLKIKVDDQDEITWVNASEFKGTFISHNNQQDMSIEEHIEEYITIDISKMDLNILSLFTGSLKMNTALSVTAEEYQFITSPQGDLTLPEKIQLDLLNADVLRLCIEESIFTPLQITNYLREKKDEFNGQLSTLLRDIELKGILDENTFFNSLDWDGDISSMDALTPILISITSKSLHPTELTISLIPPSLGIANQTFHLTGFPQKTTIYTIIFPKGISIDPININGSNIHQDKDSNGRYFIEYKIPASSFDTSQIITCHLTASPLYVLSILLPLILSIILVIILIILIYLFRKKRRGRTSKQYPSHPQEYYNREEYTPPPPPQKKQ